MTLKQRHIKTDKTLKNAARSIIDGNTLRSFSARVAPKYGVTGQTIVNYIYGQGKDGFLKEALIDELKNTVNHD